MIAHEITTEKINKVVDAARKIRIAKVNEILNALTEEQKQLLKNASASRTNNSASASTKYNAEYISAKTKEINSFKLPKQNDSEYIRIKDVEYRISHQSTYEKRHIVDIVRTSDGYSLGRDVFTNSGSYGMATTRTKSQVQKAIRKELLRLLNK